MSTDERVATLAKRMRQQLDGFSAEDALRAAAVAVAVLALRSLEDPPEAVIERTGRWMRLVYIRSGISRYGPSGHGWHVLGDARAEAKARRELARYIALHAPRDQRIIRTRA